MIWIFCIRRLLLPTLPQCILLHKWVQPLTAQDVTRFSRAADCNQPRTTTTTNRDPESLVLLQLPQTGAAFNNSQHLKSEEMPDRVSAMRWNDQQHLGFKDIGNRWRHVGDRGGLPFEGKSCCQGGSFCTEARCTQTCSLLCHPFS